MRKTSRKVVIVGTGFVGTSIAYAMINQGIANELVLIDVNQEKAEGEALDLLDGMAWGEENVAVWSGDYSECSDCWNYEGYCSTNHGSRIQRNISCCF